MHPYIGEPPDRITFLDEQLTAVIGLLRRYHETFAGDVICHGDFGPWNMVWRDRMPFAVIDFDKVYVGDADDDVAYALRTFVGYGFAPGEPVELVRRTRVALTAYGVDFKCPPSSRRSTTWRRSVAAETAGIGSLRSYRSSGRGCERTELRSGADALANVLPLVLLRRFGESNATPPGLARWGEPPVECAPRIPGSQATHVGGLRSWVYG
jgi:hypothetical protein